MATEAENRLLLCCVCTADICIYAYLKLYHTVTTAFILYLFCTVLLSYVMEWLEISVYLVGAGGKERVFHSLTSSIATALVN